MPNWLGDLVMATPLLADLRSHWPNAEITAMCQGILGSVIHQDPHIDRVLNFKHPKGYLNHQAYQDIVAPLKQRCYDLGILLTNSFSSAYWFWRGKVRHRLGYARHGRSLLLNHPIPFPPEGKNQHLVITYKMLLKPLGIPISQIAPSLYLTSGEQQNAKERLASYGWRDSDFLIGVNPGAAYGSAKCWLPPRFKELTHRLLDHSPPLKILFFGDQAGVPLVEEICSGFSDRVINLAGQTTLRELMALIQGCHLFLTNDSGPMHVSSALGVPLIALFGSTSDVTTGPYKGGHVIHKHLPCSPCHRRECPIDFRCMTRIEVAEVYETIQLFMARHRRAKAFALSKSHS